MRPKVKICGLQKPVDAQYVNDAGADYAGFVFYEKSKRNVSCQKAKKIMEKIRPDIKKAAVTVSPDAAQIQILHGTLSAEALSAVELPVWYAINLSDPKEFAEKTKDFLDLPEKLQQKITALVVDGANYGGGQTFDWQKTQTFHQTEGIFAGRKFVLAGGLHAGNVNKGIQLFHPDVVDVSSGVENENGKDEALIKQFVACVKEEAKERKER